jgi:hypothetical protein
MTRLSREQKRELKRAGRAPAPAGLTPIDVRVSAEAGATVGGMPVPAAAGESLQSAALDYLHRLALATGHPVLATVHDERIGYVVPLQVHVDGSSRFAGEPVQVAEPRGDVTTPSRPAPVAPPAPPVAAEPTVAPPAGESVAAPGPRRDNSTYVLRAVPESAARGMPEQEPTAPEPPHAQPQVHAQAPSHQPHAQHQPPQVRAQAPSQHHGGPQQSQGHAQSQSHAPEQAHAQEQPHSSEPQPQQSQSQVKREPSTMRLSAVKPVPSTGDPVGHPVNPERPKREPSTLPLTAAKATTPGQEAAGAPAAPPAAAEPKREPRTMPLTAAKPAASGVAPSTFVLRAVPEPKDGPLARPPRTPDLPLTLAGIAAPSDDAPHPRGGTTQPAPTAGEYGQDTDRSAPTTAPAAGEYGGAVAEHAGTAGPEADAYRRAGAESGDGVAPLTGEYGPLAARSVGVAEPPVGEFGPARGGAPVHAPEATSAHAPAAAPTYPSAAAPTYPPPAAPAHTSEAASTNTPEAAPTHAPNPAPAPELSPSALEPQPWPPGRYSAAAQVPAEVADAVSAQAQD